MISITKLPHKSPLKHNRMKKVYLVTWEGEVFFPLKKVWSTMGKFLSWFSLYHLTPTHFADLGPFSITNISTTYSERERGKCYKSGFSFCFSLSLLHQPTNWLSKWLNEHYFKTFHMMKLKWYWTKLNFLSNLS